MNLLRPLLLALLSPLLVSGRSLPPGFEAARSGTRHEIHGYSVAVPGKGWAQSRTEHGVVFGKRIDGTESYHAGLSVTTEPQFKDKEQLVSLAEKLINSRPLNPRFKIVRNEHTAGEEDGLWRVRGRLDFEDSGAVNVGKHEALATHNAHILMVDPQRPDQLIRLWFSWRGKEFNDDKFRNEAERFFASFQRSSGNASK